MNKYLFKIYLFFFLIITQVNPVGAVLPKDLPEYSFTTAQKINPRLVKELSSSLTRDAPLPTEVFESAFCKSITGPDLPGYCWISGIMPNVDWRATFLASSEMQREFYSRFPSGNGCTEPYEITKACFAQKYILHSLHASPEPGKKLVIRYYYGHETKLISKDQLHIEEPLIYRITSDEYGLAHVLGSMHNIPLSAFSKPTQAFLKSHDLLVLEESNTTQTLSFAPNIVEFGPGCHRKIHTFTQRKAKEILGKLIRVNTLLYDEEELDRKFDIERITPFGIWLLSYFHYCNGMDSQLEKHYMGKGSKPLSLETSGDSLLSECSAFIQSQLTLDGAEEVIDYSKMMLETLDMVVDDEDLGKYLRGVLEGEGEGSATELRNRKWVPNILKIMSDHGNRSKLFTFGADHIPGVFSLLQKEDFRIERFLPDTMTYSPVKVEALTS